jgi:AraC family transcriptional regulator of adaptative response/methylated-DNA-[protein]-cysteine methyltransferase
MAAMRDDHEIHQQPAISADPRWQRVLDRDGGADGAFVYAVTSTGIYCRPSCPARKPAPVKVRFFAVPEAAEQAGFRACKRCRPRQAKPADARLDAVSRACRAIENAENGIPTLKDLGRETGLSPDHLQRLFKALVGISPRQYGEALRVKRLKAGLREGGAVTPALYGAGYGSSSRLYEKAPAHLGMTPASYAKGGQGAEIAFATAASPLGRLLVAATEKGVCMVALGGDDGTMERALRDEFPAAEIRRGDALEGHLRAVLDHLANPISPLDLPLDVRATVFQWRVWDCLRDIPKGQTRYYKDIAAVLGKPGAARAVGRACATNPVTIVIPCHRAVSADGGLTGYRWGIGRKKKLLARERGDLFLV